MSNSDTTTVHCARTHLRLHNRTVVRSLSGSAISVAGGFSSALGRPAMVPAGVPGLLIGNTDNVTMNVTAGVPARGLDRIVSTYITCVRGGSVSVSNLVRCIGTPSFPAKNFVCNVRNIHSTCRANHNHIVVHTHTRVRPNRGRSGVIIARVPCNIGGTRLVGRVTSLIGRGGVRKVDGTGSRSSHRNVHVIVSIGHSTGTGIILGGLFGVAPLRADFDIGYVTLIGKHPELLALGSYVSGFISRHRSMIVHHAHCSLHGTRRHTRVLRKLVVTDSGVSRIIRVVHDTRGPRTTVRKLVRHFSLSRVRTGTVIRVHLHRLAGLVRRRLHGRCSRLLGRVRCFGRVLGSSGLYVRIVGSRLVKIGRRFNSRHHSRVMCSDRRFGPRSFCTSSRVIVAVDRVKCVGHAPLTRFHTRTQNKMNDGKSDAHSASFIRCVCPTAVRGAVLFFARGKHYF